MMQKKLGLPWSVQIELTEGCNRLCSFCGLNGIRTGPGNYKYMDLETASNSAKGLAALNPLLRMEFAMHGEPMMHPKHAEIISMFRAAMPKTQIMVTTNGKTMLKDMEPKLDRLFRSGVDFVVMDTYYPERDELQALARGLSDSIEVRDFYDDCVPKKWSPWHNHKRAEQRLLIIMDDLAARNGEVSSRVIMNHAGNMREKPLPAEPLVKTCTNPFRELSICYDGDINVCCMDWGHEAVMGNVNKQSIGSIWWGAKFEAFRTALQNKDRRMSPCARCDKNSGHRAGLLPKYPELTKADIKLIRKTLFEDSKPRNGFKPMCELTPGTRREG